MSNEPDNFSDTAFNQWYGDYDDNSVTAEDIADWRHAAIIKFADLINQEFNDKFPEHSDRFDREPLLAALHDALPDCTYDLEKELEND